MSRIATQMENRDESLLREVFENEYGGAEAEWEAFQAGARAAIEYAIPTVISGNERQAILARAGL